MGLMVLMSQFLELGNHDFGALLIKMNWLRFKRRRLQLAESSPGIFRRWGGGALVLGGSRDRTDHT